MRAINAIRELNDERDEPIRVIALYTETERHALFVRQADERHCLGPATIVNGDGAPHSAYLDYERLERALVETGADAAWVGWGFVAEHPAFAELCDRLDIAFAGPSAEVMRKLGDKVEGVAPKGQHPRNLSGIENRVRQATLEPPGDRGGA